MSERSGTFLRRCASAGAAVILAGALASCAEVRAHSGGGTAGTPPPTATEQHLIDSVNAYRGAHGLPALRVDANLEDKSRLWSTWMAQGGCGHNSNGNPSICHSDLASGINPGWSRIEENVASAAPSSDISGIIAGLQNSKPHSENMLNAQVNAIGIGVAYEGNVVYVAEEFMAR